MILSSLETIEDGTHILVERIAALEAENAELRKQNDILATARRLEEAERKQAEATIERLRQDIGWRDRHIDAMEAKLERT